MSLTIEDISTILLFIVPGFLAIFIRNAVKTQRELTTWEKTIGSIFLSVLCIGILCVGTVVINKILLQLKILWTLPFSLKITDLKNNLYFFVYYFSLSCIIALPIGYFVAKVEQWFYTQLRERKGLAHLKSTNSTFTDIFDTSEVRGVRVKTKDEFIYEGMVNKSSSNPGERELFLVGVSKYTPQGKKVEFDKFQYCLISDMTNKETSSISGVLIKADDIEVIEVFDIKNQKEGKSKK